MIKVIFRPAYVCCCEVTVAAEFSLFAFVFKFSIILLELTPLLVVMFPIIHRWPDNNNFLLEFVNRLCKWEKYFKLRLTPIKHLTTYNFHLLLFLALLEANLQSTFNYSHTNIKRAINRHLPARFRVCC